MLTERIVTELPLTNLWDGGKELNAKRARYVDKESIRELLKHTPVFFVMADVGSALRWISPDRCYQFWKEEVLDHLSDNDKINLDAFPGSYAYIASEWTTENREPIILLEKTH